MFELLPGTGLTLPRHAGVLRFGMSEREAQWAVATLADVRGTWVCRAGWAFTACYEGLELLAYGDCVDLGVSGFTAVHLHRRGPRLTEPSAVPVVLQDIDLFGYPANEVLAAVEPNLHPTVRLTPPPSPADHLSAVSLSAG
ncbi:hypothetical protein [Streptomyces sp. NPDC059063]|uniref:hypothetical protein n=1 Tax=Streptomyces sp. NPDC059063 TaxID=3346712 RepID=UPI0036A51498